MEAPSLEYAKTSDGVRIAYWTFGSGPALVHTPHPVWGVAHSSWQLPEVRRWYERMGEHVTLVRYDARGTGQSDRHAEDYTLEAHIRDLEAVVDALALPPFVLLGYLFTATAAIAYAVRHPERLTHLILWNGLSDINVFRDSTRSQAFESLRTLADREWDLYVSTMANNIYGARKGDFVQRIVPLMSASLSPAELTNIMAGQATFNVVDVLSRVQTPTLVVQPRGARVVGMEEARRIASEIPGARLAVLESDSTSPFLHEDLSVITAFITGVAGQPWRAAPAVSALHAILFTDIVRSTAITQELGDAKAQELVRRHNTIVREGLAGHSGTEIKHTGDGIMASFPSASSAVECAVDVQRAVAAQGDDGLRVRVGINAGEPVAEEDDLFGTAVQLARRLCEEASPGEICVSDVVRQLAAGKGLLFSDLGEVVPKGFDEAVRIYQVRWQNEG